MNMMNNMLSKPLTHESGSESERIIVKFPKRARGQGRGVGAARESIMPGRPLALSVSLPPRSAYQAVTGTSQCREWGLLERLWRLIGAWIAVHLGRLTCEKWLGNYGR
jgi:hypothetical protein